MALVDLQMSARNAENCPFFLVSWDNLFLGSSAFLYVHVVEIHSIYSSHFLEVKQNKGLKKHEDKHNSLRKDVQSMDT